MISGGNSPITAQTQTRINQLKTEKCGTDQQCLQKVDALIGKIHQRCDQEPENVSDAYKQYCLWKQLTEPAASPRRVFPFENRTDTFLGHYAVLPVAAQKGEGEKAEKKKDEEKKSEGGAGGGAAGNLPVEEAKYDSEGYRNISSLAEDAKPAAPATEAHGSLSGQLDIGKENLGGGKVSISIPWISTPDYNISSEGVVEIVSVPTITHPDPITLLKGPHDRTFFVKEFDVVPVRLEIPLGGQLVVEIPDINLIEVNDNASKLEKAILERFGWERKKDESGAKEQVAKWGNRASKIYLDSVLRKTFAATEEGHAFFKAWDLVVVLGTRKYEEFLNGTSLPMADQANLWAEFFKYDPMGFVDAIALWAGKKPEEVRKALEGRVSWATFQTNNAADRVSNFAKVLEEAGKEYSSKVFSLPGDAGNQTEPNTIEKPEMMLDRTEGYAYAMEQHKGGVMKTLSLKKEDELKKLVEEVKVKNPFDLRGNNDPGNVWAAQKRWKDFVGAVIAQKMPETGRAKWFLIFRGGYQGYGADNSGLGGSGRVERRFGEKGEDGKVGVRVYVGTSRSTIEFDADPGPSLLEDSTTDGYALGISSDGEYVIYKSNDGFFRAVKVTGAISYATAGSDAVLGTSKAVTEGEVGLETTLDVGRELTVGLVGAHRRRAPNDGSPEDYRYIWAATTSLHLTEQLRFDSSLFYRPGAPLGDFVDLAPDRPPLGRDISGAAPDLRYRVGETAWVGRHELVFKFNEKLEAALGTAWWYSCNEYNPQACDTSLFGGGRVKLTF